MILTALATQARTSSGTTDRVVFLTLKVQWFVVAAGTSPSAFEGSVSPPW